MFNFAYYKTKLCLKKPKKNALVHQSIYILRFSNHFFLLLLLLSFLFSFKKERERLKTQGLSSYLHVLKMVKVTDGAKNTTKRICPFHML